MSVTNNRINTTIDAAVLATIKTKLSEINAALPFLISLTPDERKNLPKINEANKIFVEDAITGMQNNAAIIPSYLNIANVKNDLTLFQQLDDVISVINQIHQKMSDTQMLAGSEAYVSSLTAYRLFESASNAGVDGTTAVYNSLRQRFSNQGSSESAAKNNEPK